MNIINLPDVLIKSKIVEGANNIIFYHHKRGGSSFRSKISFNMHCLLFLISGKKHILVGDEEFYYDNSSCLFFKAGNYLSTVIDKDDFPYQSLLIFFDTKTLNGFMHKFQDSFDSQKAINTPKHYLSMNSDSYIDNFKNSVISLLSESKHISSAFQKIKFEEIMFYLFEQHGKSLVTFYNQKINPKTLDFFKLVVDSNSDGNISIDEMAFLCHMSRSTFKRTFMKVYGTSPGQWLREKRLDRSAFLLNVERTTPSEVYILVGFSSLSSFIQSFKKRFGVTPKQYQLNSN